MIRAVLFDLDGVLIDSYEVWFHLLASAARRLGGRPVTRAAFEQTWGQGIAADIERFYPGQTVETLEDDYCRHFLDHAEHLRVDPAAARVLAELRARGVRSALVTNSPSSLASGILERAGLAMDVVVGGTDVPRPKPAPDMIARACERLGVDHRAALVVGETDFDRQAAEAAGIRFVGLRTAGDPRLENLEEILGVVAGEAGSRVA